MLVNTEIDAQQQVTERLRLVEGVDETQALFGMYDVLVKVSASSVDSLKDLAKFKIRSLSGVTNLLTLMIMDKKPELVALN